MSKEQKTPTALAELVEVELLKHPLWQAGIAIGIQGCDSSCTGVNWRVRLLQPNSTLKAQWFQALNEVLPSLQLAYDLVSEPSGTD